MEQYWVYYPLEAHFVMKIKQRGSCWARTVAIMRPKTMLVKPFYTSPVIDEN